MIGSALDAYDSFKKGNIGMGLLSVGLAALDLTAGGAIIKGLAVGAFKWGARTALKQVYKKGRSMVWENVRNHMLTRKFVTKNVATHHWMITQDFAAKWKISNRILNHPFNLMPDIEDGAHVLAHHGTYLQELRHGTPGWAKWAAGNTAASTAVGWGVGSGDEEDSDE